MGPPAWLFSNNSNNKASDPTTPPSDHTMGKKADKSKPLGAQGSTTASEPPAQLVDLVEQFLSDYGFDNARSALMKQRTKNGWAPASALSSADGTLVALFQTWQASKDAGDRDNSETTSDSSDSSSDSSSSSESDSDSEGGVETKTKVASAKTTAARDTKSLKRKTPPSSDASSSDSSSSEDSDCESSSASSDGKPASKKQKVESESDSDSSSDSDSDSDSSDSSSSSSDESSDSDSEEETTPAPKRVNGKAKAQRGDTAKKSRQEPSKDGSQTSETVDTVSDSTSSASSLPANATDNGKDKETQKQNQPFSRIPKDIKVEAKFASNAYVPVSYSLRAHEDLIVTKGKGFTKEKNKKKKGSFRGGAIDIHEKKSVYFDD